MQHTHFTIGNPETFVCTWVKNNKRESKPYTLNSALASHLNTIRAFPVCSTVLLPAIEILSPHSCFRNIFIHIAHHHPGKPTLCNYPTLFSILLHYQKTRWCSFLKDFSTFLHLTNIYCRSTMLGPEKR